MIDGISLRNRASDHLEAAECTADARNLSGLRSGRRRAVRRQRRLSPASPPIRHGRLSPSDLIVRAGGSCDVLGSHRGSRRHVHLLTAARRLTPRRSAAPCCARCDWYDRLPEASARRGSQRPTPSPGNKKGGLSNVVEKSLGSVAKSGTSPLVDVIGPGERLRRKGLTFAATPAGDFVCGTLQLAAGMNLHVFTTGRGTPYNLPTTPDNQGGDQQCIGRALA